MIKFSQPASVQAAILSLRARRFNPYPPSKHETLGFSIYKFKISDNSLAVIKKELEPKRCFWQEMDSLLDAEDGIRGEIIRGFTESPLRSVVVPGSGAHRAQAIETPEGRNFAELDREYNFLPQEKKGISATNQG